MVSFATIIRWDQRNPFNPPIEQVVRFLVLLLLLAAAASGVSLQKPALSAEVDEKTCSARKAATTFRSVDRQIFFSMIARGVSAGDRLRIEWIAPSNTISDNVDYNDLPAAPALCFVTQLPVSGFPASSQPGKWSVRVVVNNVEVLRLPFEMGGAEGTGRLRVGNITRTVAADHVELVLDGVGFEPTSVVHIAEYRREGGWRYIHSLIPTTATSNRLTVRIPTLGAGEYIAIVKNADDSLSQPSRLLVSSESGYQLPLAPGERWLITQGPYGSFSHWGNTIHAYDIAPRTGQWIAAMRAGVVHTHDIGAVQSHTQRTFGNYITIDHGDGEYSHYGHLATRTFQVRDGEHVEAGQILAHVGNSGYTLGEGGGYHVHVQVSRNLPIYSPSIPFRFREFAELSPTALRNREVVSTAPAAMARSVQATVTAGAAAIQTPVQARVAKSGGGPTIRKAGRVAVAGTWTEMVSVPASSRALELVLQWARTDRDVDLRVVSPSGRQFGALGDPAGYSGPRTNPKRFRISDPEPGIWLVIAAGMLGGGEAIEFTLEAAVTPPENRQPLRRTRRVGNSATVSNTSVPAQASYGN